MRPPFFSSFQRPATASVAANTFGFYLDRPSSLPPIPDTEQCGWPALTVSIEECVPFPWHLRGRHPWLDGFIETDSHIIGVESKRYEPFRSKQAAEFSDAYWRPVLRHRRNGRLLPRTWLYLRSADGHPTKYYQCVGGVGLPGTKLSSAVGAGVSSRCELINSR